MTAKRISATAKAKESPIELGVQRGSLVRLNEALAKGLSDLAIIVSNEIQNESSEFLLCVPLERRRSRLKAPFAVDLGRDEGLRELHTARCDWVTRIEKARIASIERAGYPEEFLNKLESALSVALGFRELI